MPSVARYLLNEASSDQLITTIVDDTGNGNDLTITYGIAGDGWSTIPAGNGIYFTSSGGALLTDIVNNGTVATALHGSTQASLIISADVFAAYANGRRLFQIGATGNTEGSFGLYRTATDYTITWQGESVTYLADDLDAGADIYHLIVNTAEEIPADRCQLYINGVLQVATAGVLTQNLALAINDATYSACLGNRGNLDRGALSTHYYVELFDHPLSAQEIASSITAITADNDSNWASSSTTDVENTTSLQWSIRSHVESAKMFQWAIRSHVENNNTMQWSLQEAVQSDISVQWSIREFVEASNTAQWSIRNYLESSETLQWGIVSSVESTSEIQWAIRSSVEIGHTLQWSISSALASVENSFAIQWSIQESVESNSTIQWAAQSFVENTHELQWSVREYLENSRTLQWQILAESNFNDIDGEVTAITRGKITAKSRNKISAISRIPIINAR